MPEPSGPTLVRDAERRVLAVLAACGLCGMFQLIFAFTIPYLTIGLLGLFVLGGSTALARDVWYERRRFIWIGIFQPIPSFLIVYTSYVNLAEALDADDTSLATEDDLERSVQENMADRVSANAGIGIDVLLVLLCFMLSDAMLTLRRASLGKEETDEPWILQLIGALGRQAPLSTPSFMAGPPAGPGDRRLSPPPQRMPAPFPPFAAVRLPAPPIGGAARAGELV